MFLRRRRRRWFRCGLCLDGGDFMFTGASSGRNHGTLVAEVVAGVILDAAASELLR